MALQLNTTERFGADQWTPNGYLSFELANPDDSNDYVTVHVNLDDGAVHIYGTPPHIYAMPDRPAKVKLGKQCSAQPYEFFIESLKEAAE